MADHTYQIGETALRDLLAKAYDRGCNIRQGPPYRDRYVRKVLASLSESAQEPATPAAITAGEALIERVRQRIKTSVGVSTSPKWVDGDLALLLKVVDQKEIARLKDGHFESAECFRERAEAAEQRLAELEAERGATPAPQPSEVERFTCAARRGKTDPPPDCDWPFCGCDPHATKVIEALDECGKLTSPPVPSGWQQRERAVFIDGFASGVCAVNPDRSLAWFPEEGYAAYVSDRPNAKDALPPAPDASPAKETR